MSVVIKNCNIEAARAPVHLVRPCLHVLHGQLVSQRLRLALVCVIGHNINNQKQHHWP